jgi:hypothetical protein
MNVRNSACNKTGFKNVLCSLHSIQITNYSAATITSLLARNSHQSAWKQLLRLRAHTFETKSRNVPPTTWNSFYKPRVYQQMSRVLPSSSNKFQYCLTNVVINNNSSLQIHLHFNFQSQRVMSLRQAETVYFTWPYQISVKLIFLLQLMQQRYSKQYFNSINVFGSSQTDNSNPFTDVRNEGYQKASMYSAFTTLDKLSWTKLDSTDQKSHIYE